jgi:hypothetical protein
MTATKDIYEVKGKTHMIGGRKRTVRPVYFVRKK